MIDTSHRSGELDWLLDELTEHVAQVRHAVVLSNDGLAVGASHGLTREDAEHLAAVASGFHSLAKGAGRHFDAGAVRQTMVELDRGFLFVAAAGRAPAWPCSPRPRPMSASSRTRWPGWCDGWASTCTPRRAPGAPTVRSAADPMGQDRV